MRKPSETFDRSVRSVWGNPKRVAQAGLNETFQHEEVFGLDHDDQVDNALRIGILAGQSASPDAFIEGFTRLLNME